MDLFNYRFVVLILSIAGILMFTDFFSTSIFSNYSIAMHTEVYHWLKNQRIHVSKSFLELRIKSHPDYPSILAVQDTLEEMGLITGAYETDKENLSKTAKPFLAHLKIQGGQLKGFQNLKAAEASVSDFENKWSGVVLLLEGRQKSEHPEYRVALKEERRSHFLTKVIISVMVVGLLSLFIKDINTVLLSLLFSCSAGLYLGWLIIQKEFGVTNSISEKICSLMGRSRCESVLFSKGARIKSWLTWGDVGVIWFATSILFVILLQIGINALNRKDSLSFYTMLSTVGAFFPVYSLYYQWRVVKQWCMLCIGVLICLSLNTGLLLVAGYLSSGILQVQAAPVLVFSSILFFVFASWLLLKSWMEKQQRAVKEKIGLQRYKRSPSVFFGLLQHEEMKHENLPQPDEALFYGNPAAPLQIVVACNPYCGPCAKAHQMLEELYQQNKQGLGISVRFALSGIQQEDEKVKAARAVLAKAGENTAYKAIEAWYAEMNLDRYGKLFKADIKTTLITSELEKQVAWAKNAGINGTPTFFLNGRKLPEIIRWSDMADVLRYEIQNT